MTRVGRRVLAAITVAALAHAAPADFVSLTHDGKSTCIIVHPTNDRLTAVSASPFIPTRSIALFNVWSMPIDLTRRHNTESWSIDRLERYLDMYDRFGFNAIESHDRFNDNYLEPLFGLTRNDWREKVQRRCDHAHENGQQFFLRIWGHVVMETPRFTQPLGPTASVPKRLAYLCVNDPRERARWDAEILGYYVGRSGPFSKISCAKSAANPPASRNDRAPPARPRTKMIRMQKPTRMNPPLMTPRIAWSLFSLFATLALSSTAQDGKPSRAKYACE